MLFYLHFIRFGVKLHVKLKCVGKNYTTYLTNVHREVKTFFKKRITKTFASIVETQLKSKETPKFLEYLISSLPNGIGKDLFVAICDTLNTKVWAGK